MHRFPFPIFYTIEDDQRVIHSVFDIGNIPEMRQNCRQHLRQTYEPPSIPL